MLYAILLIMWGVCGVVIIFAIMMILRAEWVCNRRNELNRFENGVHVIDMYSSHRTMMNKFWVCDVEKFKLKDTN
jgi:hypothetical protein